MLTVFFVDQYDSVPQVRGLFILYIHTKTAGLVPVSMYLSLWSQRKPWMKTATSKSVPLFRASSKKQKKKKKKQSPSHIVL